MIRKTLFILRTPDRDEREGELIVCHAMLDAMLETTDRPELACFVLRNASWDDGSGPYALQPGDEISVRYEMMEPTQ